MGEQAPSRILGFSKKVSWNDSIFKTASRFRVCFCQSESSSPCLGTRPPFPNPPSGAGSCSFLCEERRFPLPRFLLFRQRKFRQAEKFIQMRICSPLRRESGCSSASSPRYFSSHSRDFFILARTVQENREGERKEVAHSSLPLLPACLAMHPCYFLVISLLNLQTISFHREHVPSQLSFFLFFCALKTPLVAPRRKTGCHFSPRLPCAVH